VPCVSHAHFRFFAAVDPIKVSYSHLARLHWHCVTRDVRYEARTEHELPVLVRYIPKELLEPAGICIPDATVLDLILYSREQIAEEYKSMGRENTSSLLPDAEWSIISVKPQTESFETPMQPITMCSSPLCVFSFSHIPMDVLSGCGTAWAWPKAAAGFPCPEKSMRTAWRFGATTFQSSDDNMHRTRRRTQ
jgi:hypothetical protein